jgi:hypothetical protein
MLSGKLRGLADQRPSPDTGTPRWVKIAGLVALVLVVLFVVVALTGRDGHGPGRHMLGTDTGGVARVLR